MVLRLHASLELNFWARTVSIAADMSCSQSSLGNFLTCTHAACDQRWSNRGNPAFVAASFTCTALCLNVFGCVCVCVCRRAPEAGMSLRARNVTNPPTASAQPQSRKTTVKFLVWERDGLLKLDSDKFNTYCPATEHFFGQLTC